MVQPSRLTDQPNRFFRKLNILHSGMGFLTVHFSIFDIDSSPWCFVVAFLYTAFLISAAVVVKLLSNRHYVYEAEKTQKIILYFIFLYSAIRCFTFWGLSVYKWANFSDLPDGLWFSLLTIASNCFCLTYISLIYFWAKMYYFAQGGESRSWTLMVSLVALLFAFQIVEYILFFGNLGSMSDNFVEFGVSNLFNAAYSITLAVGFIVYGYRIYHMFQKPMFAALQQGSRMLVVVGLISAVCFSVRAAILLVDVFTDLYPLVFLFVFFVLCELVPSTVLLYLFAKAPQPTQSAIPSYYHTLRKDHTVLKPLLEVQ